MPNILIDPVLVVAPSEQASKAEVENWFNSLILWLEEATTPFYDWFYSPNIIWLIGESRQYPTFFTLQTLVRRYRVDVDVPLVLIANRLKELFNNENHELKIQDFDRRLEALNYDVEFQPDSTQITPPEFTLRWPAPIQAEMLNLFGKLCVYKFAGDEFVTNLTIATSHLPKAQNKQIEVETIVTLAIGSPKLEQLLENSSLTEVFPLLFTPDDLPLLDVLYLWAQGEAGIKKAISQQYQQQQGNASMFEYYLGKDFIKDVETASLHTNVTLLRTMIKSMVVVLADKAKDLGVELEQLRESKNANSAQRTKNGAGAWRLRITTKGAGWRLHYWRKNNIIEFSNVVRESGDDIFGPYFL